MGYNSGRSGDETKALLNQVDYKNIYVGIRADSSTNTNDSTTDLKANGLIVGTGNTKQASAFLNGIASTQGAVIVDSNGVPFAENNVFDLTAATFIANGDSPITIGSGMVIPSLSNVRNGLDNGLGYLNALLKINFRYNLNSTEVFTDNNALVQVTEVTMSGNNPVLHMCYNRAVGTTAYCFNISLNSGDGSYVIQEMQNGSFILQLEDLYSLTVDQFNLLGSNTIIEAFGCELLHCLWNEPNFKIYCTVTDEWYFDIYRITLNGGVITVSGGDDIRLIDFMKGTPSGDPGDVMVINESGNPSWSALSIGAYQVEDAEELSSDECERLQAGNIYTDGAYTGLVISKDASNLLCFLFYDDTTRGEQTYQKAGGVWSRASNNNFYYATLNTAQTFTGQKTFSSDCLRVNDIKSSGGILMMQQRASNQNGFIFNGTIEPYRTNTYDIGTSSKTVKNLYLNGYITDNTNSITVAKMENKDNKVTSITSSSTNVEYPSAKAVYDAIEAAIGNALDRNY